MVVTNAWMEALEEKLRIKEAESNKTKRTAMSLMPS